MIVYEYEQKEKEMSQYKYNKQFHKRESVSNSNNSKTKSHKNNKKNNRNYIAKPENPIYLIPIILVIAVLPFIVRLKQYKTNLDHFTWFNAEHNYDLFLYYKQWILIYIGIFMLGIILYKKYKKRIDLNLIPIFIPLGIYAFLVIVSTLFSPYLSYSLKGGFDQFESTFALLSYCIIVYYTYLFVNTEEDVKYVLKYFIISIIIFNIIGLLQFLGYDYIETQLAHDVIVPRDYRAFIENFKSGFEKGVVYVTIFNPNYVGVYVGLIVPFLLTLLVFAKSWKKVILYVVSIIGLIICIVGARSLGGLISLGVSILCLVIFLWRFFWKKYYITIPSIIVIILTFVIISSFNNHVMINRIIDMFHVDKTENNLTDIQTNADDVTFLYKKNKLTISFLHDNDNENSMNFNVIDGQGLPVNYTFNNDMNVFMIQEDERFAGIFFGPVMYENYYGFRVNVDGYDWVFTNQTEDGTYYHINRYGKLDKIITAPSAVLTGYENIATRRGYIWSRTIPLIKDRIILGSGPDTFIMSFPQRDYVNFVNYLYYDQIITKPHSLYLQMAVQTGLLSLLAYLVFYGMYFISSVRLYIKGHFKSYYAKVGLAIFIGTLSYMISSITNDSSITTAPIFWVFMGIGISMNYKAKPFIKEEMTEIEAMKIEKQK